MITVNPIAITGGTREIEILDAMSECLYLSLLLIKVSARIAVHLASAVFAIYLAGIAWFCFEETRQPAPRRPGDNLTGDVARRAPGVTTDFIGVSQATGVRQ
jgi:hypothetical protein